MSEAIVTFSDGRRVTVAAKSEDEARRMAYRIERAAAIVSVDAV